MGRGPRSPQASLGPRRLPARRRGQGASLKGLPRSPGRSGGACARSLPRGLCRRSPRPGADDSPCRLIAALKNFALGAGEAGVAATGRRGRARARVPGAARTHLPSCHPLREPWLWRHPQSERLRALHAHSVRWRRVSRPRPPEAPRVWTKPHPCSPGTPRVGAPRPPARKPSARESARPFRGAPRVCVGLANRDGCGQEQVAQYF